MWELGIITRIEGYILFVVRKLLSFLVEKPFTI
jgi:hypothetical protein